MKRARRILLIALASAAGVLALVLLTAAFLLFTTPGAKVVLAVVNGRDLPVRARSIRGALASRFELRGLELLAGRVEATADTVAIAWRPLALRAHHIDVTDVFAAGARVLVRSTGADSTKTNAPADTTAGGGWKITAQRARVRGASVDAPGGVHLHEVSVDGSGGPDGYRADVRASGSVWRLPDMITFVRASGNTRAAAADSIDVRMLDGTVRGGAFVRWSPGVSWRARLEGDSLRVGALAGKPDDWLGAIAFRARSTGLVHDDTTRIGIDLASLQGALRGQPLSARARVDIDGARIAASDASLRWGRAHATLSGHMDEIADVRFDATVPSLSEIVPRARGWARVRGRLSGTPERIEVGVTASGDDVVMSGHDIPYFEATLNAIADAGNYVPHSVELRRAAIRIAGGTMDVTGRASWEHGVEWDVTLAADDFETSTVAPVKWDVRGPMSMRASTSGSARDGTLRADVALASLSGLIRDRPLSGAGRIAVKNGEADLRDLHVEWGDARARADGHAGETLDLDVGLVAPDLSVLVSSWRGSASVEGRATGPRRRPGVAATIAADSVRIGDYGVHHLDAHVAADASFASPADIRLTALGVSRGETVLDTIRVELTGPRAGHRASLAAVQGDTRAEITLQGTYADSTWSGFIEDLRLRQALAGEWRLDRRAPVHVSRSRTAVDSLVVVSGSGRLAAGGAWDRSGQTRATVQLDGFELAALQRFLAPELRITGTLNGTATLVKDPRAGIDARVDLVPGPGTLARGTGAIEYKGHIAGRADGTGVSVQVDLALTRGRAALGRVGGELAIPGFVAGRDSLGGQPIEGRIDAECADIGPLLAVMAPPLAKSSGVFSAHVTPLGTAGDFRLVGKAALENARFDITRGLHLRDTDLSLSSDGEGNVSLEGGVTSGGGRVAIKASSARSENGWVNGTFSAKGDRFQLLNQPDAQVFLSPDLEVRLAERTAAITGTVRVPYARIETTQVPASAASPSPDVVIVEDTLTTKPKLQVRTQVRVALGDSVTFNGFGLQARLAGDLLVDDQRGRPTRGTGEIQIVDGKYRAFGNELTIDPGRFIFGGGPIDNPGIDVRAYRGLTTQNVMAGSGEMVGINLRGTLRKPETSFFSNPPMAQGEIMSYLVTGRSSTTTSGEEQSALANAAMMIGMQQGTNFAGDMGKKFALDEAYLEAGTEQGEASFVAGKYLSPKLYVSYAAGLFEHTNTFRTRYSLASRWTLQTESGTEANSSDILYWFERGK